MSTLQEFVASYQKRRAVEQFAKREGLVALSLGHHICPECDAEWEDDGACPNGHGNREVWEEPHFSWRSCICCNSSLGGNRHHIIGLDPQTKEIHGYNVCEDCAIEIGS